MEEKDGKDGDSKSQEDILLPTHEAQVAFSILLDCLSENKQSKNTLVARMQETVLRLKQRIQAQFDIPACCQRLYFESIPLRDGEMLQFYRLQDGDELYVRYTAEGDVKDVLGAVSMMQGLIVFLEPLQSELSKSLTPILDLHISTTVKDACRKVESLASEYFQPCSSDRADANRRLFIDGNGLDVMHKLHTILLQVPWRHMPVELQLLEHSILRILWNITASFSIRSLVLHSPTLEAISLSMLRVVIEPRKNIKTPKNEYSWRLTSEQEFDRIAAKVVQKAIGTMCNLAELPECRVQIASNEQLLEQFMGAMLTPSYTYIVSLVTAAGLLCLAYSSETHHHLAKPHIIDGIMEACMMQRPWCRITDEERRLNCLLLRYFTTMFFAQLASVSLLLLKPKHISKILEFISDFIETADYTEVRQQEFENGYIWSTLVPFMKLVYQPSPNCSTDGSEKTLQELCIEAGVFSLQNMLSGEASRKVLIQEGLVEYVTCMPWYTPKVVQKRAEQLVSMLGKKIQLQPPRLGVMTRAKLATLHFGFERVLQAVSVHELLAEVYQITE